MKIPGTSTKHWVAAVSIACMAHVAFAQELMDSVAMDESKIVAAIAPYSEDMRMAILNAAEYPQALVKLSRTQARSSQAFQDAIGDYPRNMQEKFYQVARFPEIDAQLVKLGRDHKQQAGDIIKSAPEGVQEAMMDVYSNHYERLARIDKLYNSSQSAFDRITSRYTQEDKDAFRKIVDKPDVMNLLTDNIDLTVSLGESYKSDPKGVVNYLDSLNQKIEQQNTTDLADYKKAVENDPELRSEMEKAATEFAQQYDTQSNAQAATNYNYYGSAPYPYWFGYPYWYGSAMWYPTPFYFNTGFYYGMNGGLVVFGLPSFAYANWFFGYGYHHYPGLYRYYNSYYNVHRAAIANGNVYRGFNTVAVNHFRTVDPIHGPATVANGNRSRPNTFSMHSPNATTLRQPINGRQFNSGNFSHFNANAYHDMSWQRMQSGGFHGNIGGMNSGFHSAMSGGMHGRR